MEPRLGLVIPVGPFQLRVLCDSVKNIHVVYTELFSIFMRHKYINKDYAVQVVLYMPSPLLVVLDEGSKNVPI